MGLIAKAVWNFHLAIKVSSRPIGQYRCASANLKVHILRLFTYKCSTRWIDRWFMNYKSILKCIFLSIPMHMILRLYILKNFWVDGMNELSGGGTVGGVFLGHLFPVSKPYTAPDWWPQPNAKEYRGHIGAAITLPLSTHSHLPLLSSCKLACQGSFLSYISNFSTSWWLIVSNRMQTQSGVLLICKISESLKNTPFMFLAPHVL